MGAPWADAPPCPAVVKEEPCGGPGCLTPFNPRGWYGPEGATLFCQACGTGWYGTDDEIERALIAAAWWDAFEGSGLSEIAFAWFTAAEQVPCGKRCFERGCQQPHMHWSSNAKLCPKPECFHGIPCARCRILLEQGPRTAVA